MEERTTDSTPPRSRSRDHRGRFRPGRTTITVEQIESAIDLRRDGHGFREIARRLGLPTSTVFDAVAEHMKAARARLVERAELAVALSCERLDNALVHVTNLMATDTAKAVAALVRIEARRAKLLGLDAPAKHEMTVVQQETQREAEALILELMEALQLTPEQRRLASNFFARRAELARQGATPPPAPHAARDDDADD